MAITIHSINHKGGPFVLGAFLGCLWHRGLTAYAR